MNEKVDTVARVEGQEVDKWESHVVSAEVMLRQVARHATQRGASEVRRHKEMMP